MAHLKRQSSKRRLPCRRRRVCLAVWTAKQSPCAQIAVLQVLPYGEDQQRTSCYVMPVVYSKCLAFMMAKLFICLPCVCDFLVKNCIMLPGPRR